MSALTDLEGILADPTTDAAIVSAIIAVGEKILATVKSHDAGDMTAAHAAASIVGTIAGDKTADDEADRAGQDAINKRFPEVAPKP